MIDAGHDSATVNNLDRATLADIHLNNRLSGNSSRPIDNRPAVANATTVYVDSELSEYAGDREPYQAHYGSPKAHHGRGGGSPPGRRCYVCNAPGYVARNCPRRRGGRGNYHGNIRGNPTRAQVNLCTTMGVPHRDVGTQCEVTNDELGLWRQWPS